MAIRITGLNSGLDTEAIISALVSSYSYKTDKYTKAQTKLSWKQDAWKSLNTKIYSLYKNVGNLRYSSAYASNTATISDSTKATVTAGSGAVKGTQYLKVSQLATSGYLTGGKLEKATDASTTMADLGYTGNQTSIDVTVNGEKQSISFDRTSKISDVVGKLQDAGVNASFDVANKRLFVSAKKTGAENDFTLSADSDNGKALLSTLGLSETTDAEMAQYQSLATAYGSYSLGSASDAADVEPPTIYSIWKNKKAANDANVAATIENKQYQEEIDALKAGGTLSSEDETKIAEYQGKIDANNAIIASNNDILTQNTEITAAMTEDDVKAFYEEIQQAKASLDGSGRGASRIAGQDSVIYLNDVKYTGTSNSFTINGLTINALQTTGDNTVAITTSTDTQGLYDTVKDFLSQYNSLINEMTSLYNADSAKGYEPLTTEEKDSMSDTEVEQWEKKVKDALLRRDGTLNDVLGVMTSAMAGSYTVNGKSYNLSTFGISTLGYLNAAENEQSAYHIDGDSDDSATSGNTDKLMAALTSDPDTVIDFMKQLSTGLYTAIDEKMRSSKSLSSAYVVYNDKEMASEYSDYTTTIKKWEDKLTEQEDYYYDKFSAMETALATLQSQTSSLTSLFG